MRSRLDTRKGIDRAEHSRQLKLDLREAIAAERASERTFAESIAVTKTALRNKLDPETDAQFSVLDFERAPETFRRRLLAKWASELGFDLAPIAESQSGIRQSAELLRAASSSAISAIEASADGRLDRSEAASLKPLLADVRRIAAGMEREADRAISEGVVSLSQPGGQA